MWRKAVPVFIARQFSTGRNRPPWQLAPQRGAARPGQLFRLGLYLTVHADSKEDLAAEAQAVRELAASLLLVTVPATFRSLQGWTTTLPAGTDPVRRRARQAGHPHPPRPVDPHRRQRAAAGRAVPAGRAALDKAIMTAYLQAGISPPTRAPGRPAPLLPALAIAHGPLLSGSSISEPSTVL